MPRTILYDHDTGAVLVLDPALDEQGEPILPSGIDARMLTLTDAEAAKLSQPGSYTVDTQGRLTVTPPGPEAPAVVERQTALSDLQTQYDAAIARLDQIITATTPTNAQVIAAVRDMATYQRKTLRFLHAQYTNGG